MRLQGFEDLTDFSEDAASGALCGFGLRGREPDGCGHRLVRRQKKWKVLERRREALKLMAGRDDGDGRRSNRGGSLMER